MTTAALSGSLANMVKISRIKKLLSGRAGVEIAFVFGSAAKDTMRAESDVDVALLLKRLPAAGKRLDLRTTLAGELDKILGREVDIVIINTAGSFLKYEIAKHGKLIYERQKGSAKKFKLNAIKEYFDYLPTFNFHYERLRRKNNGKYPSY